MLDVEINPNKSNKLTKISFVKCNQILTIAKIRLIKYLGSISTKELNEVDKMLKLSLDLK